MIQCTTSRKFMQWIARYLLHHLNPLHVSIALLDKDALSYSIQISEGSYRIPPRLISLNTDSPLIKWFLAGVDDLRSPSRSRRVILTEDLRTKPASEAGPILHEFRIHHIAVCVKIETSSRLAGYLLIGPRETGERYTEDDLSFLQILANDIAIELEKEEYYHYSQTDPLTALYNRSALDSRLQYFNRQCEEPGIEYGIALIDIDFFKRINDTHGHPLGDLVLKLTASLLRANVRKKDLVFRYGGEEFLIIFRKERREEGHRMSEREFHEAMENVAERLRLKFADRPMKILSNEIQLTISVGLSFLSKKNRLNAQCVQQADLALYCAKRNGRNRVCVYDKIQAES